MKKSTIIVGMLFLVGIVFFSSMSFAANYSNSQYTMQNNSRWNQQVNATTERCPWYKRWVGIHNNGCTQNNGCTWNNNCSNNSCR